MPTLSMRAAWLLWLAGVAACSNPSATAPTAPAPDATTARTTLPDVGPGDADAGPPPCRPVGAPANPAELRLPCERTQEPCDGVDNDGDGITDPKCPTQSCASDADCTFGALMGDADCCTRRCDASTCDQPDDCGGVCECGTAGPAHVCNQIDAVSLHRSPFLCWGVLCPPGTKCVEGQCVTPGHGLPGTACTSGKDCDGHSGCIVNSRGQGRCLAFCQAFPCPDGWYCSSYRYAGPSGAEVLHETCRLSGTCSAVTDMCVGELTACVAEPGCQTALACARDRCGGEVDGPPEASPEPDPDLCLDACLRLAAPSPAAEALRLCAERECAADPGAGRRP